MKPFKILLILFFITTSIFAKEAELLEVDELESYIQKNVIVVDIRTQKQWNKTGIIPNSYKISYDKNEKKWLQILMRVLKEKNRAFVLISKDGKKAKDLANRLYKEKKFTNIKYLDGGIDSWINSNRKVIND